MRNLGQRFLPVCAQGLILQRWEQTETSSDFFKIVGFLAERETRGTIAEIEKKKPRPKEILLWISVSFEFHSVLPYTSLDSQDIKVAHLLLPHYTWKMRHVRSMFSPYHVWLGSRNEAFLLQALLFFDLHAKIVQIFLAKSSRISYFILMHYSLPPACNKFSLSCEVMSFFQ